MVPEAYTKEDGPSSLTAPTVRGQMPAPAPPPDAGSAAPSPDPGKGARTQATMSALLAAPPPPLPRQPLSGAAVAPTSGPAPVGTANGTGAGAGCGAGCHSCRTGVCCTGDCVCGGAACESAGLCRGARSRLPACDDQACWADGCCAPECDSDRCNRFYGGAEYLLWAIRDSHTPPLVTTGPARVPTAALGEPGTAVLFGGDIDNEERSGGRFTAGYWLDCCQQNAVEGSYFFLGDRSTDFNSKMSVLGRPFFSTGLGMQTAQLTSFPGVAADSIHVQAPSELQGANIDWRHELCCGCSYRIDALAGFRWVELKEGLHITEDITLLPGIVTNPNFHSAFPFVPGTHWVIQDRFDTRNEFYGTQLGLDAELHRGRWSLDLKTTVALGDMHEVVNIGGDQVVTPPHGAPQVFQGGLLALSSNSGHFERNRFAVAPEAGITAGYQVTDHVKLCAGYNFLFMSNVVRPGDQIDTVLNPRLIPNFIKTGPGAAGTNAFPFQRPEFQFHETSFWAQGVTVGVELKF